MSNVFHGAVEWSGKHPVTLAVGVFALGALALLLLKGNGGSAAAGGMSAFYAAQAAQAASGNSLMATQDQDKTAVALAGISAGRDTTLGLASLGTQQTLGLAANDTAQQAQKQQFFLAAGQQQLEGQAMPFLLQKLGSGGPGDATDASTVAAAQIWQDFINGGVTYAAH